MELVSTPETVSYFKEQYNQSYEGHTVIRYGDLKKQLAADMVSFIRPIRQKTEAILADKAYLQQVMATGKDKARASAVATINEVRKAIGVSYFSF
jgi:tryptophanyl-tRNA synthetase